MFPWGFIFPSFPAYQLSKTISLRDKSQVFKVFLTDFIFLAIFQILWLSVGGSTFFNKSHRNIHIFCIFMNEKKSCKKITSRFFLLKKDISEDTDHIPRPKSPPLSLGWPDFLNSNFLEAYQIELYDFNGNYIYFEILDFFMLIISHFEKCINQICNLFSYVSNFGILYSNLHLAILWNFNGSLGRERRFLDET